MEGIGGVAEEAKEETQVAVDEEDDEIEYMPPTAVGERSNSYSSVPCDWTLRSAWPRAAVCAPVRDA